MKKQNKNKTKTKQNKNKNKMKRKKKRTCWCFLLNWAFLPTLNKNTKTQIQGHSFESSFDQGPSPAPWTGLSIYFPEQDKEQDEDHKQDQAQHQTQKARIQRAQQEQKISTILDQQPLPTRLAFPLICQANGRENAKPSDA